MPTISVKIMKTKEKQTKTESSKGNRSYSERGRAKWFCCAFKLGFLQLICKGSLIFKSNLELASSIILKQRELYEPKHVPVECRCLKILDLLSFLICFSILVLKWRQVSTKNIVIFIQTNLSFFGVKKNLSTTILDRNMQMLHLKVFKNMKNESTKRIN